MKKNTVFYLTCNKSIKKTKFITSASRSSFWLSLLLVLIIQLAFIDRLSCQTMNMTLTFELKGQSLDKGLQRLSKVSGFHISYSIQQVSPYTSITVPKETRTMEKTLVLLLKNTSLEYTVRDKNILIHSKEAEQPRSKSSSKGTVFGLVTDIDNLPLPGVLVRVKNSADGSGTITDADGQYRLEANLGEVIVYSCLGYYTNEENVAGKQAYNVVLKQQINALDEVLVIGYGTTTKRTSTGSVSKISAKEIENQPVTNILQTLQGRIPGAYITQSSGYPGSEVNVKIRGTNSIDAGNLPLYIIDGVPFIGSDIKETVQNSYVIKGAQKSSSPLNLINTNDIESIEVLKDADATAIYGSRGANGVILITTRRGQAGKTSFSVNMTTGISDVAKMVKTLNTQQYLGMLSTALANSNKQASASSTGIALLDFDQTAYTNWQKKLIGGNAQTKDITARLSGGNASTNFLVSASYHNETTVIPGDYSYKKFSSNIKVNHAVLDNRLKVAASVLFSTDDNQLPYFDMTTYAFNTAPNHTIYNEDGTYYWSPTYFSDINPLGVLNKKVVDRGTNLVTSFNLQYELMKGLVFKTDLGYGRAEIESKQTLPSSGMNWVYYKKNKISMNASRSFYSSINYTHNFTVDPQLFYQLKLGKTSLKTLLGGSWQSRKSEMPTYVMSSGYSSDNLIGIISSAATVTARNGSLEYKYASAFGRITYDYDEKYVINANFRRDGSSRFGKNHRYGNFGSIGAAWIFSKENFFKDLSLVSFAKLRSSYGWVGNDVIGDYGYADTYTSTTYASSSAIYPTRIANPNYRWEITRKFEVALDLNFIDDRFSFEASFYKNRSGNQLIQTTLASQTGFSNYQANLPALVENRGWEFTFNTHNISTKYFEWTTSFNISLNRNELKKFPGIESTSYYSKYVVGRPLNGRYLFHFTGVDNVGESQFEDMNGDNEIVSGFADTGKGDKKYFGHTDPKYFGGLQNSISYKGLALDFLFQFVNQKGMKLMSANGTQPGYASGFANYQVDEYNEYLSQGHALKSTYIRSFYNYIASDAMLVNTSFIKLKNVNLSYSFSPALANKLGMQHFRIYALGQNLLTLTKYKGWDPETPSVVLPPLRTVTIGVQITF